MFILPGNSDSVIFLLLLRTKSIEMHLCWKFSCDVFFGRVGVGGLYPYLYIFCIKMRILQFINYTQHCQVIGEWGRGGGGYVSLLASFISSVHLLQVIGFPLISL